MCKGGETHIQRQVHTQHIHPAQQLLPAHPPRPALLRLRQPVPVVVHDLHAQRLRLARQVLPDAAHAQDAEQLALRVVAEGGRGVAAPGAAAEGEQGRVEVAQAAQEEEECGVGRGGVDGRGDVGDGDAGGGAVGGGELVVACAWGVLVGFHGLVVGSEWGWGLPLWLMLLTPTPSLPSARTTSPSSLPVMETLPKVR